MAAGKCAALSYISPIILATIDPRTDNSYGESKERVTHNVEMKFKNIESKFSGQLREGWAEYVDFYKKMALDDNLHQEQKRQYPHNL